MYAQSPAVRVSRAEDLAIKAQYRKFFSVRRVGGLLFIRIGRIGGSFYITRSN